jgi:hypothetical protein
MLKNILLDSIRIAVNMGSIIENGIDGIHNESNVKIMLHM